MKDFGTFFRNILFLLLFSLVSLVLVFSCKRSSSQISSKTYRCLDCHKIKLDDKHSFSCTVCHQGKEPAPSATVAHKNLLARPAAPAFMEKTCGSCHPEKTRALKKAPHFTLEKEINLVLKAFGLSTVSSPLALKEPEQIQNLEDLVHDLLRRRCLRCHLYYEGDSYAETRRGLGCAACHLPYGNGGLESHTFLSSPPDRNCLHCHYGNRVGFDYYGMFEHDYPYQFRSPLLEGELPPRPWGVEFHEMQPDVHLEAGMPCLACHTGSELMEGQKGPQCTDCHRNLPGKFHAPQVLQKAQCSTCHATWSFQDQGTYLLLHYEPDWEEWAEFYAQGSSEVEEIISNYFREGKAKALMKDKFSGRLKAGIWFLGFKKRRFAEIPLGRDDKGRLSVMRPLLDLHLSLVTPEEEVLFDNISPSKIKKDPKARYLPYSPHTIGQADYFRTQKVLKMTDERSNFEPQRP